MRRPVIAACVAFAVLVSSATAHAAAQYGVGFASRTGGHVNFFTVGLDDAVWTRAWSASGGWSQWTSLGGGARSAPRAVAWQNGRLDVFVRGNDGAAYQKVYTPAGGWSAWVNLGGSFTSEISAASPHSGRLDIFGRDTAGHISYRTWLSGSGWSGWMQLSQSVARGVGPLWWNPGGGSDRLDAFSIDATGTLVEGVHASPFNAWSWYTLSGGALTAAPSASGLNDDRIDIVGRGLEGAVYQRTWTAIPTGWSSWISLGGSVRDAPQGIWWHDGTAQRFDVAALGTLGNVVFRTWRQAAGWNSWADIGSPSANGAPFGGSDGVVDTPAELDALVSSLATQTAAARQEVWLMLGNESRDYFVDQLLSIAELNRASYGMSSGEATVRALLVDPSAQGTLRDFGAPMTSAERTAFASDAAPGALYDGAPDAPNGINPPEESEIPGGGQNGAPYDGELSGPDGQDSTTGYGCDPAETSGCSNAATFSDAQGLTPEQPSDDLAAVDATAAVQAATADGSCRTWFCRAGAVADANAHAAPGTARTGLFEPIGDSDCTNFVSQSWHFGGGLNMTEKWRIHKWLIFRRWTASWAAVRNFVSYMVDVRQIARLIPATPSSATLPAGTGLGDAIEYDWGTGEGWSHLAVAVDLTNSYHLISQHSVDRRRSSWRRGYMKQTNPAARAAMRTRVVHVRVR